MHLDDFVSLFYDFYEDIFNGLLSKSLVVSQGRITKKMLLVFLSVSAGLSYRGKSKISLIHFKKEQYFEQKN